MYRVKTGAGITSPNLPFPAGGIRRPHPRLIIGGRGCGNGWSLHDMSRKLKGELKNENISQSL